MAFGISKKIYKIAFKINSINIICILMRSIFGIFLYLLLLFLCNYNSLDQINIFEDWPLRQKDSDLSKFYKEQDDKEIAEFIKDNFFANSITCFDLVFFFINWGILISSSVRLIRDPKKKMRINIIMYIKDIINFCFIISKITQVKRDEGFLNFLLFCLNSIYKECFITALLNTCFRTYVFCDLLDYNYYRSRFFTLQKILLFLFGILLISFLAFNLIVIPYTLIGFVFVIPLFIIWFIPAAMIASIFILPFYCFFNWYYGRIEEAIWEEREDMHPIERHYILKDERTEYRERKLIFQILTSLKFLQIISSISVSFAALILKGFSIGGIYRMYFGIPFMSLNIYTLQFSKIKDQIQFWLNQFFNLF